MAKSRKKAAELTTDTATTEDTSFNPAEFDPALKQQADAIVQDVAEATRPPETEHPGNGFASQHAPRTFASGHIANPSSKRRESHTATVDRRLPSAMSVTAGDLIVKLIDKGDNSAGIGIRVELPDGRTLTDAEKEIIRRHVKGEDGENTGYSWNRDVGMWAKQIVRDGEFEDQVPPNRPVAIRLDAERRVQQLAEALREHAADPVSYADRVRQEREQAASSDRIPD